MESLEKKLDSLMDRLGQPEETTASQLLSRQLFSPSSTDSRAGAAEHAEHDRWQSPGRR